MIFPTKEGISYYNLNVNFHKNYEARRTIRTCGGETIAILTGTLSLIHFINGYYIDWDPKDITLKLNDLIGYEGLYQEKNVINILTNAVKNGYFNKNIFNRFKVLTSREVQKNYIKIAKHIPDEFQSSEFNLVSDIKIPLYKTSKRRMYEINVNKWLKMRTEVFERDHYTCQYCGQVGGGLEADHVIPFSKGGTDDLENLVTACKKCNRQKRDKSVEEFRKWKQEHDRV